MARSNRPCIIRALEQFGGGTPLPGIRKQGRQIKRMIVAFGALVKTEYECIESLLKTINVVENYLLKSTVRKGSAQNCSFVVFLGLWCDIPYDIL